MEIQTAELLNKLCCAKDIKAFFSEYEREFLQVSVPELLNDLAARRELSVATVAKNSGQSDYVYKVFNGTRKPSRDILLAIAVGMSMTVEETQLLLRVAKAAALDPRDKRDSAVIYGIKENLSVVRLNDLLYELGEPTL